MPTARHNQHIFCPWVIFHGGECMGMNIGLLLCWGASFIGTNCYCRFFAMPCRLTRRKMGRKERGVPYTCHACVPVLCDLHRYANHDQQGTASNASGTETIQTRFGDDHNEADYENQRSGNLEKFMRYFVGHYTEEQCNDRDNAGTQSPPFTMVSVFFSFCSATP